MKPTLGFGSRTEAVIALFQAGNTGPEVASTLGINLNTVYALKRKGSKVDLARLQLRRSIAGLDTKTKARLRPHAARRGLSVANLTNMIIERVAQDGLVDAILDDETRAGA